VSGSDHPLIQCSTGPFWTWALEAALDTIAEAGFSSIELMVTRDPHTQDPERVSGLARARGLDVATVHAPFLVLTRAVWGLDPVAKIRRGVEMCTEVGARILVVHPPLAWERGYARWLRSEAASGADVVIAVENMYPTWVAGRRLRAYRWTDPADLASSAAHVVLDLSHLAVARHDALAGYELLRSKLVHMHLSDNAGDGRDGHLPLGSGIVPIRALLAEMRRTHYAGGISLELAVRHYMQRPSDLVATLRSNRLLVEGAMAGSSHANEETRGS
jgi:sugar phosphate isomerase/epimerase